MCFKQKNCDRHMRLGLVIFTFTFDLGYQTICSYCLYLWPWLPDNMFILSLPLTLVTRQSVHIVFTFDLGYRTICSYCLPLTLVTRQSVHIVFTFDLGYQTICSYCLYLWPWLPDNLCILSLPLALVTRQSVHIVFNHFLLILDTFC